MADPIAAPVQTRTRKTPTWVWILVIGGILAFLLLLAGGLAVGALWFLASRAVESPSAVSLGNMPEEAVAALLPQNLDPKQMAEAQELLRQLMSEVQESGLNPAIAVPSVGGADLLSVNVAKDGSYRMEGRAATAEDVAAALDKAQEQVCQLQRELGGPTAPRGSLRICVARSAPKDRLVPLLEICAERGLTAMVVTEPDAP